MAQLYSDRLCFAHIPKCGGTWVRKVLEDQGMKITQEFGGNHHPAPEGPWTTFTFVRHPATWLASWWAHEQRHGWPDDGPLPESFNRDGIYEKMILTCGQFRSDDFNKFACDLEQAHPGFVGKFFREFTANCDYIGRQETLIRDLSVITGVEIERERYNETPAEWRATISPGTYTFVENHEPMDWLGY